MRRLAATGLLLLFCFAPARTAERKGSLTGTVDRPALVTKVYAKDRATEQDTVYPGKLDAKTGRFVIEGLPLGATYDCVIDLTGGARLEGINLKVHASAYAEAGEDEQPLTKEDIEALKKTCNNLNKFEDRIEVLTITGNAQYAAVLLNKLREKPFYGSKPDEVIWRLELWHFEKPEETWVKDQDELFVTFYRERLPRKDFEKKALTLDPALGGHKLTVEKPSADLGKIELPAAKPGIRIRK
jgi:hypothetical protein